MGGIGSGSRGFRGRCEDMHPVDLADLNRRGLKVGTVRQRRRGSRVDDPAPAAMPTAREYLTALNGQIEQARLALDERRSLLRLMEEQGEETEDARRILIRLQHTLDEMIQLRDAVLREIEEDGA